jgi:hypothetical protein
MGTKLTVVHLFVEFKKASDSVKREILYNFLIDVDITMKLVRLIRMYLTL